METKRQQFETTKQKITDFLLDMDAQGEIEIWATAEELAERLEKQLEVRAISDEEIDIIGNKRTDLENVGERIAFKKGMLALRDLMNDRANGWISAKDRLPELKTHFDERLGKLLLDVSVEVIVTDGEDSWPDSYSADLGFHSSITHWMPLPSPPNE